MPDVVVKNLSEISKLDIPVVEEKSFTVNLHNGKITGKSGLDLRRFAKQLDTNLVYVLMQELGARCGLKFSSGSIDIENTAKIEYFQKWLAEKEAYNVAKANTSEFQD